MNCNGGFNRSRALFGGLMAEPFKEYMSVRRHQKGDEKGQDDFEGVSCDESSRGKQKRSCRLADRLK